MRYNVFLPQILLIIFLALASTMSSAASTLFLDILEKEKASDATAVEVDITKEVKKYIPIGSTVESAKNMLEINGFEVTLDRANRKEFLSGQKEMSRSIFGFKSADIALEIQNDRVFDVVGTIFVHMP